MCQTTATWEPGINMILQISDARHRSRNLDALIKYRNPPAIGSATTASGHPETFLVHKIERLKIIQCANTIPGLHRCRGIAARIPPPHVMIVGAVMNTLDLPQLQRVDYETNITITGKPGSMMLVVHLVAIADITLLNFPVAAHIQDGWRRFLQSLGHV